MNWFKKLFGKREESVSITTIAQTLSGQQTRTAAPTERESVKNSEVPLKKEASSSSSSFSQKLWGIDFNPSNAMTLTFEKLKSAIEGLEKCEDKGDRFEACRGKDRSVTLFFNKNGTFCEAVIERGAKTDFLNFQSGRIRDVLLANGYKAIERHKESETFKSQDATVFVRYAPNGKVKYLRYQIHAPSVRTTPRVSATEHQRSDNSSDRSRKVILWAGPGPEGVKKEAANEMRKKTPDVDVLICTVASEAKELLIPFGDLAVFPLLLFYCLPRHPDGSNGARNWVVGFMRSVENEVGKRNLCSVPRIQVLINEDQGAIDVMCPWTSVRARDVVALVEVLETVFSKLGWSDRSLQTKAVISAQDLFQMGVNYRERGSWVLAADYIRQAADLGHAEAQFNYALMCMRGDGVTKSDSEAIRWMRKSADNGFWQAKRNVEILRMTGFM